MMSVLGLNVIVSPYLPIDETRLCCDIETKEEISLLTGGEINCIHLENENTLVVSKEIYNKLKLEIDEQYRKKN